MVQPTNQPKTAANKNKILKTKQSFLCIWYFVHINYVPKMSLKLKKSQLHRRKQKKIQNEINANSHTHKHTTNIQDFLHFFRFESCNHTLERPCYCFYYFIPNRWCARVMCHYCDFVYLVRFTIENIQFFNSRLVSDNNVHLKTISKREKQSFKTEIH